jgi:hypothetical protein
MNGARANDCLPGFASFAHASSSNNVEPTTPGDPFSTEAREYVDCLIEAIRRSVAAR